MDFSNLKIENFTKDHIQEYLTFCYDAYLSDRPQFYQNTPQARQQFNQLTTKGILQFIDAAEEVNKRKNTKTMFNFFVRKDGQMIGAYFQCELHYFFKELIQKENFQNHTYKNIPLEMALTVEQCSAVLSFRSATKSNYHKSGLYQFLQCERKKLFLSEGYEFVYAITTNPKVLGFYKKNKGQFLFTFHEKFVSSSYQYYFIRLKFDNVPEYSGKQLKKEQ